jgi:predicted dehydrogenase
MQNIGVAIIGAGGVALANHLPGIALAPGAKVVALCDTDPAVLERALQRTGPVATFTDYQELLKHSGCRCGDRRDAELSACADHSGGGRGG